MREKSRLTLFVVKLLYLKDKDKNLKDNLREMSDVYKGGAEWFRVFSMGAGRQWKKSLQSAGGK